MCCRSNGPAVQESCRSTAKAVGPHTRLNIVIHREHSIVKFPQITIKLNISINHRGDASSLLLTPVIRQATTRTAHPAHHLSVKTFPVEEFFSEKRLYQVSHNNWEVLAQPFDFFNYHIPTMMLNLVLVGSA